jgi:hypothetical protein
MVTRIDVAVFAAPRKGAVMCGRFTNRLTWRETVALYRLSVPAIPERNLPARYNICPPDTIDAVIERMGTRELVPMRWGLIPSWWKKTAKETPPTFNARAVIFLGNFWIMLCVDNSASCVAPIELGPRMGWAAGR